jgi:Ni/Co efflux regulator RcnB
MRFFKKHLLWTLALAVAGSTAGVVQASAQDHDRDDYKHHDKDWNKNRDKDWNKNRDRDRDRDHDRDHEWRNRNNGYYNNGRYNNGGYYGNNGGYYGNNGGYYGNNGGYYGRSNSGAYGRGGMNQASQVGYQDGIRDGQNDRATGHSFRPTQDDNYRNASRGYSSVMGDKNQYKSIYRQGYQQGYQQGYGSGGGRRWGF